MREPPESVIRSIRDVNTGQWIKPPTPTREIVPDPVPDSREDTVDLRERLLHAERLIADYQAELLAVQGREKALKARVAELEEQVRALQEQQGIRPGGERDSL